VDTFCRMSISYADKLLERAAPVMPARLLAMNLDKTGNFYSYHKSISIMAGTWSLAVRSSQRSQLLRRGSVRGAPR
jgi:hypothetical protein